MSNNIKPQVRFTRDTYKRFCELNPIIPDGVIIVVTKLPWYKSWFGLKPTRLKIGDGVTTFNKLRFL